MLVVAALAIAPVLKTFLVQAFVIPSGSMEDTIRIGDRVLVDKLTPWFGSRPQRGDIVVFKDPGDWLAGEPTPPDHSPAAVQELEKGLSSIGLLPSGGDRDLIKRVVAVGGDTVKCCDSDGKVTVNGEALDEPYLHPGNAPSAIDFDVKVPAGRLFVMGDHRADSADSRYHLDEKSQGTVPASDVVGRAVAIGWPVGHWRGLPEPATYASVPEARGSPPGGVSASPTVASRGTNPMPPPPTPAELPLVMGVVVLSRVPGGRSYGVNSHKVKEWMWGTWRSAHDPDTMVPRRDASSSPSRPQP